MLRAGIEGPHSQSKYIYSLCQWHVRVYVGHQRNFCCYSLTSARKSSVGTGFRRKAHKAYHPLSGTNVGSISNATKRDLHVPSKSPVTSIRPLAKAVESTHHQSPVLEIHPLHRPPPATTSSPDTTPPTPAALEELVHEAHAQNMSEYSNNNSMGNRDELLQTIIVSETIYQAWDAYSTLLHMQKHGIGIPSDGPMIPHRHLHHLAKLLSRTKPRTREVFLRLLSVLTTLRSSGGKIYKNEWNNLIHCAGKGWRKTTIEDYRAALGVFEDMTGSGQTSLSNGLGHEIQDDSTIMTTSENHVQPDIVTFTILIDIAARTTEESALRHATSLLNASGIPWNSKTHRAMIPYYLRKNQLHPIPGILAASVAEGLDIRAINNCMWAFACKGRLRIAVQVYDHLRQNIPPEHRLDVGSDSTTLDGYGGLEGENPILVTPGFIENATMPPDIVTYTLLIQALCYRGDLRGALTIFRDMVTTVNPSSVTAKGDTPVYYKPTSAIYRAIFLGFARHAHEKPPTLAESLLDKQEGIDEVPLPEFAARLTATPTAIYNPSPIPTKALTFDSPWNLDNLEAIFERFLELDWEQDAVAGEPTKTPSDRMIYWIMVAYAKTCNQDVRKMYTVWKRLNRRFQFDVLGKRLSQRLNRLGREWERRHEQAESNNSV